MKHVRFGTKMFKIVYVILSPDVACTFQAKTGGKFTPLIVLSDKDMDIDTMIINYNTGVTDAVRYVGRNAAEKSHGPPKMFSTSVMRGEI